MAGQRFDSGDASPEPLTQPLRFNRSGQIAKNRLMKSAMSEYLASWSAKNITERGIPTPESIELYKRWGEGGWGTIVTGNIDIQFDALDGIADMIITPECDFEGERFDHFKSLAKAATANGSLLLGQISHPGRQVQARVNPVAISASDVQLDPRLGMVFGKPQAATEEDIKGVIEGFTYAAIYLEKAGFSGIQLHAAHGYLLSQFLSRTTNLRTDRYGAQNMENRLRLLSEITESVKAAVSPSFIIGVKLNSVEFQSGGVTAEEATQVVQTLEEHGIDFVELSGGTFEQMQSTWEKESTRQREAFFIEFAETITKASGKDRKMKTFMVGGLRSTGAMLKALEVVDGVGIGRPSAAEPDLAAKLLHPDPKQRVRGALQPVIDFGQDMGLPMGIAMTHMSQIGQGHDPLDISDKETLEHFLQDLGKWHHAMVEDGAKMEYIRAAEYSGVKVFHRRELPN